jgi:ABC-2 type transport system permease protein
MTAEIGCIFQFTRKELYLSFKGFKSDLLDNLISFANWVVVFGYFMPSAARNDLGSLILVGAIASFGFFGIIWRATILAQDITDKKVNAYLILPMPSSYVFIGTVISWSIYAATITLCLFPIGKLILWNQLDVSHLSILKCIVIFALSHVFYGFFALWVSSLVTNLRSTGWLWSRVVNPLFMFSGFFYTWKEAYAMSPWIGGLNLVNPLLYILEATKVSFFGPEGYLPYWLSILAVALYTTFFAIDGVRRFKKRIDYV